MRTCLARVLAVVAVLLGLAAFTTAPVSAAPAATAPCASVSVGDVDQAEGSGGGYTTFLFTVTVTVAPGCAVKGSVDFHTEDGDPAAGGATAPSDYLATSGTLTWSDASSRTIPVAVVRDGVFEPDEQFWLVLDNPVGLTVNGGAAVGGIINDDPPVTPGTTVSIDGSPKCWDVCSVGVHSTGSYDGPVTVHWRTVDNGGPNLGYVPVKDAVLTIPAGALRANLTVQLQNPDNRQFQFTVQLSAPTPGILGTAKSTVTVAP